MKPYPLLILCCAALLITGCEAEKSDLPVVQTDIAHRRDGVLEFLRPDGSVIKEIQIEIAETEEARRQGLMRRRTLDYDTGMLFIMDDDAQQRFWMRNTYIPLDILFVGSDAEVVNIARRTTPLSDESILSEGPAKYIVEVRAGFADRYGLTDSTRIRWRRLDES